MLACFPPGTLLYYLFGLLRTGQSRPQATLVSRNSLPVADSRELAIGTMYPAPVSFCSRLATIESVAASCVEPREGKERVEAIPITILKAELPSPAAPNLVTAKENEMPGEIDLDRRLIQIDGEDAKPFLQNLVTNNVEKLANGLVYSALLTPQGKFLADFFMVPFGRTLLLDVHEKLADRTLNRLSLYKMRANVQFEILSEQVCRGIVNPPPGAFADPRHPSLGWRVYGTAECGTDQADWNAIRVAHCIPESCTELIPDSTYILEAGFDRLNGVDFTKGCYVGQEVTARMRHKTKLRKGLATVEINGSARTGDPIWANGREVGKIFTISGKLAIAFLRFDRLGDLELSAGDARVSLLPTTDSN